MKGIFVFFWLAVCGGVSAQTSAIPKTGKNLPAQSGRLADAYERIDPEKDGWSSEADAQRFSETLTEVLKSFLKGERSSHLHENFQTQQILAPATQVVFAEAGLEVRRAGGHQSDAGIGELVPFEKLRLRDGAKYKSKIKVTQIAGEISECLVTLKSAALQINATWQCRWTDPKSPALREIRLLKYEEVARTAGPTLLADVTESVFGRATPYQSQLLHSSDHWRSRLPRDLGLDPTANHGLAIGDVNGDGLEDLYLCQQGGLPNLLFLQNADGTMRDFSAESQTDWLDFCAAALFVDLDNDGDQDLVISQDFKILFMDNTDGQGHFELAFGHSTKGQSFSLSAADFDQDGLLDVYICGYNPSFAAARAGALGEPMPYHDANNGGSNILWRNLGDWTFADVTAEVGLDVDNTRFSYAASWEDYDQDGDLDLYVANDYGRNCLYQNQGGQDGKLPTFENIAARLGIEDSAAGMSTNWGDYNRDGWMDLYVSNMFSSAGNRITGQERFLREMDQDREAAQTFRRMARGNTLFASDGKGGFVDASTATSTTMARWCWGSTFADLNNDGWLDLLAANGFITAEDNGDL